MIGDFTYGASEETIKNLIEEEILRYEADNFGSDYKPFHGLVIATTNQEQKNAAEALKLLGFKGTKFDSMHENPGNLELTFWKRKGFPRNIASRLRKENKDLIKEYRNDRW